MFFKNLSWVFLQMILVMIFFFSKLIEIFWSGQCCNEKSRGGKFSPGPESFSPPAGNSPPSGWPRILPTDKSTGSWSCCCWQRERERNLYFLMRNLRVPPFTKSDPRVHVHSFHFTISKHKIFATLKRLKELSGQVIPNFYL